MSELKACHNDLPDRLRWWAAHCDMTSCGCRISSLMMQAADTLERCDRPDQLPGPGEMIPDNAPLTLAELRGMDGEPVWVTHSDGSGGRWGIVNSYNHGLCADVDSGMAYWFDDHIGNVAYRRKPETEGGEG